MSNDIITPAPAFFKAPSIDAPACVYKALMAYQKATQLYDEALAKIKQKSYGLVISDWNMEPMTGYELLQKVRAEPATAHIPFIMVTAESKTDNVVAARKAGVNNYIVKPFNAQTLKNKIEQALGQSAAA